MGKKNVLARMGNRLRRYYDTHCQPHLIKAASRRTALSRLYYRLFSSAFSGEQHAVVSGMAEYGRTLSSSSPGPVYLLRRNIHRLEKGLIMRPRRDIYALSYIRETVDAFYRVHAAKESTDVILWAASVLDAYFKAVTSHPIIDAEKLRFRSVKLEKAVEYAEAAMGSSETRVSYSDLFDLMQSRKSVRWFRQQPVPREIIDRAVAAAALSPSSCNRQPFEFFIIDDPILVGQVAGAPMGTAGFADNIPVMVALIGHLQAFFSERDRHLIYIDASLAAMSFILALETQGVASCCINWPDMADREELLRGILHLEVFKRPVMLMAVGYPAENSPVAQSQRKTVEELRHYNLP